jgi:hypothetical protein
MHAELRKVTYHAFGSSAFWMKLEEIGENSLVGHEYFIYKLQERIFRTEYKQVSAE